MIPKEAASAAHAVKDANEGRTSWSTALGKVGTFIFGEKNTENWQRKLVVVGACEAVFFLTACIDLATSGGLSSSFGIHPRSWKGLAEMLIAPLLHVSFTHFLIDVVPFFVLGMLVMLRQEGMIVFAFLTALNTAAGGLLVWGFGRTDTPHDTASATVFAYFGYLLLYGAVVREPRAALMSIVVFVVYGGVFWGVIPFSEPKVSFEAHLAGLLIGAALGIMDGRTYVASRDGDSADGSGTSTHEKSPLTADEARTDSAVDQLDD